ncbi:MAG: hypothetical protein ACE5OQ_10940 [Woeseia sp.]
MSADKERPDYLLSVTVLWGLIGCGGAFAADHETPDMEFLEYLGSWEESDEDWLLFDRATGEALAADDDERSDPAPAGKESMESEDES